MTRSKSGYLGMLLIGLFLGLAVAPSRALVATECDRIEMFSREDCPHCARARSFLEELQNEQPALEIAIHDLARDPEALRALQALAREHGRKSIGVPAFAICDSFLVGFLDADATGREIRDALRLGELRSTDEAIEVPWLGRLSSEDMGLVGFTLAVGLLDGLNPCAMWVLLILLSILVGIRDRKKLILVAGTFVVVSGLAYFVFMAAWLNVFLWIGWSRHLQLALGAIAVAVGALQTKDVFAPHRGPSLSIPASAKPGLYRRMRSIARARNLSATLLGALILALLANGVELLCTAGLPALYTQVLTLHELERWEYYAYLALYNVAYMTDDFFMVATAVVTMNRFKLQERHGRWLKALSGALMLGLGLTLWFRPEWLSA